MEYDLIGRRIGDYELRERLGAGGMASVYKAYHAAGGRYVAIKILPVHLAANETLRHRFEREANMAARLRHPHILPVYEFGEDAGIPYIVMKLVTGGTLDMQIKRGRLPLPAITRILGQIAQGLDYAHRQGVIHRDIKPDNILFETDGHAYLADFGVARLYETGENITGTGGFIGTAAYASPEQCRGEDLTPASDLYSLGVVLYEMLTGTLPFSGPTPLSIMHQHISEPPPNPLKHRPDLPLGVAEVMRKALAKFPSVRYQTADAMHTALLQTLKRELGGKPFGDDAPPLGPNPVFDKPTYPPPPPIPDDLLRDLSLAGDRPQPSNSIIRPLTPPDPLPPLAERRAEHGNSYALFLVLMSLVLLAVFVLALVLRG